MAVSKGLCLSWFVDPSLPPALLLDSTRLQQILLNLLSNAIKFTKSGTVSLEITGRQLAMPPAAAASWDADIESHTRYHHSSDYQVQVKVQVREKREEQQHTWKSLERC